MREVGWRIFWVGEQVWFRFLKGEKRIFFRFSGQRWVDFCEWIYVIEFYLEQFEFP